MKLLSRILFFILFVFVSSLFAAPAHAMTARGGQAVYIPKDEVVAGTLIAGGNLVTIDGVVHGDLFCGSQTVVITGTVDGDVICGAQTIRISGSVGGSVRAGAQTVEIAGPVRRNITVGAQTLTIDPASSVSGEIMAAVQHASIDSRVGGDVSIADESLAFGEHAVILGSVRYQSNNVATLAPTATIAGTITQTVPKAAEKTPMAGVKKASRTGGVVGKIIFYLIVGAIIVAVAPKKTGRILDIMKTSPGRLMLTGFVEIIVIPMVIILMAITIIGIPFAILSGILFAVVIVAAEIFASILAGRFILDKFGANRKNNMYLNVLVGVPVACILFAIPVLGGIAGFLAVIWGLGAITKSKKGNK